MLITSLVENLRIPLSGALLFVVFILLFLAWALYSVILRYHWKKYGYSRADLLKMELFYFIGSGIILLGALLFAILYTFSPVTL